MRNKRYYRTVAWFCLAMKYAVCAPAGLAPQAPTTTMRYAPPEATFNAGNQLQLFQDEVKQQQFPAAAARLESLLRDSADMLIAQSDETSVLSVSAWAQNLPSQTKNLLGPSYESAVGATAQQAVAEAQGRPDADPADFYALFQRYPLARAASAALAEGARRSALLGDVPTARWMLDAATAGGWVADPSFARELNQAPPAATGYCGELPFQASWYGLRTRQAWGALRSFPFAARDAIFVVGPEQVIAMKENGAVLWTGPAGGQASAGPDVSAILGATRGPSFSPAVLCDAAGAPQLLVVRQPEVHGNGWALQALRADDGHLLWTTQGQDDYHGLVFGSNPVVLGRYVYAIAGDLSDQLDHLWLIALEATTGKQLWRCDIGTESRTNVVGIRNVAQAASYRPWLNESAPVARGDLVIAAPSVGAVIAVGRFDGKLRWTRGYQTLADPSIPLQRQRDFAIGHPTSLTPLPPGLSLRYRGTPAFAGEAIIAAPQDSNQVIALSTHDGNPLWQSDDLPESTLIGTSGDAPILAGVRLTGLDLSTGKVAWTYQDQAVRGPAVVYGDQVLARTTRGLAIVSAKTGLPVAPVEPVPDLAAAIAVEPAHSVLLANDVAHCFGAPDNRKDRP
jgi:outer membrane protein assembly factor BamB